MSSSCFNTSMMPDILNQACMISWAKVRSDASGGKSGDTPIKKPLEVSWNSPSVPSSKSSGTTGTFTP